MEADENSMLHAKKPVSVGHISLEVSNLTAAKKFYGPLLDELGFKVILEDEETLGWSNENFKIFLGKPNGQRVSKKRLSEDEFLIAEHVALLLGSRSDVNAVAACMSKHGVNPFFPAEEHPEFVPGYYSVSYVDPDNNVLELYSTST